jgi:Flp pilus assembly protein TadG
MTKLGLLKQRRQGQSLVEFALAIPFLLVVTVAIIYFGKLFYIKQTIVYAAQEAASICARTPNLQDPGVRDFIRGFDTSGTATNGNSVINSILGSANLLSQGNTGNLPNGASIQILPWDSDGSPESTTPPGTVSVRVVWPFSLFGNAQNNSSFGGQALTIAMTPTPQDNPVSFSFFTMSEKATVTPEVYEQGATP